MPVRDRDLLTLGSGHGRVPVGSSRGRILSEYVRRGLREDAPELEAHRQVRGLPDVNPGFGGNQRENRD